VFWLSLIVNPTAPTFQNFSQTKVLSSTMKTNIKVYFQESSIHGFPYIVNRELHLVERVLWVIALLISFICCGFLIYEIGVKVQEDAMVTFTSDTAIAVVDVSVCSRIMYFDFSLIFLFSKIPFPAVTFCPDMNSYNNKFDYNRIVTALTQGQMAIENVTEKEFVT
jgi:hypothetical protein